MLNVKGTAVQKRLQKDSLVVFKAVLPSNEGSWMLGNKKLGQILRSHESMAIRTMESRKGEEERKEERKDGRKERNK